MDKINNHNKITKLITDIQNYIDKTNEKIKTNETNKTSILTSTFIYGENGVGKTTLVNKVLNDLNYNIYEYSLFSTKNKNITDFYYDYNKQNKSIMDIFSNNNKKGILLIDNIDIINTIDKNTIASLIKILRPKKKKITHNICNIQIIIIGNNDCDKKIKELMKICNIINIEAPKYNDLYNIIRDRFINIDDKCITNFLDIHKNINYYIIDKFADLYKSKNINQFIKYSTDTLTNNNVKYINYSIFKNRLYFNDDNNKINDTDKTTVSLLFHENIIDYITTNKMLSINIYKQILENFCFGDYIDRIIFQKQLWQLNEISFKIKVINNNLLFHNYIELYNIKNNIKLNNIRFTKILTKYSSEFNNYTFIINMCQAIDIDKKDLLLFTYIIKNNYNQNNLYYLTDKYNITILDINRLVKIISNINNNND